MLVILAFVMGLMSKPMVVTLPFVLLLLDYWPLNRLPIADSARLTADKCQLPIETRKYFGLIYEKIPLFALSAISSVITFAAQQHGESVVSLTQLPLHIRTINAIGNYFNYVAKIIYPKGLAALYPLPKNVTIDTALIAVMGIVIILALWGRGRRWLVVGLLWYLGTLVPVIGFVQVGAQMMADRYTYLPSIGLFIIFAWGAEEIFSRLAWTRYFRAILASGTAAILIAMIFMTRIQIGYWHDSGTLYKRAIAVTENNSIMVYNYGLSLCKQGKYEEGIQRLKEAIQIRPNYILARQDLAVALLEQGKFDDAIVLLNGTLQWANEWPDAYKLYYALGWAYEQKDNLSLAETNYRKALELKPDYTPVQNGLASVLTKRRQRNIERPTLNIEP
jgi:tetratricopeptide (TPR) repeat protein